MFLSFLEKLQIILKYSFSSFLAIGLLLLSFLFFLLLIINIKQRKKIVNYFAIFVILLVVILLICFNIDYAIYCSNYLIKGILKYFYFPSTVIYFLLFVVVTFVAIYTTLSNKLSFIKKIINYLCCGIFYFLFFSFISIVSYNKLNLDDKVQLYTNDLILTFVQISNLIFIVWLVYTFFWYLFKFFKKKYD